MTPWQRLVLRFLIRILDAVLATNPYGTGTQPHRAARNLINDGMGYLQNDNAAQSEAEYESERAG